MRLTTLFLTIGFVAIIVSGCAAANQSAKNLPTKAVVDSDTFTFTLQNGVVLAEIPDTPRNRSYLDCVDGTLVSMFVQDDPIIAYVQCRAVAYCGSNGCKMMVFERQGHETLGFARSFSGAVIIEPKLQRWGQSSASSYLLRFDSGTSGIWDGHPTFDIVRDNGIVLANIIDDLSNRSFRRCIGEFGMKILYGSPSGQTEKCWDEPCLWLHAHCGDTTRLFKLFGGKTYNFMKDY